jgi:hypothetical protein
MGNLRIGEIEKRIGKIIISSWFSEININPEFTFTIDVYNPDDDDSPLILSYDHLFKSNVLNSKYLGQASLTFDHGELNNCGNLIYVDDEEFEAIDLSVVITKKPLGNFISGIGNIKNEESHETLAIKFDAYIKFNKTERIEYDFSNYIFQKEKMTDLLYTISNKDKALNYKRAVPYVHIPEELIAQWNSAYSPDCKWFFEMYNDSEIERFHQINNQISLLLRTFEDKGEEFPGIPAIFDDRAWSDLMAKCQSTLKIIKQST